MTDWTRLLSQWWWSSLLVFQGSCHVTLLPPPSPAAPLPHNGKHDPTEFRREHIRGKCVLTCISWNAGSHAGLRRARFSYITSVCTLVEEWGPCVRGRKALSLKSVLCVLWDECVREDTIPEWGDWGSLELAGPLWLQKDLHYDGNRRFTVFLSERTAGRILTELKQKGLCGSGDARLAAASPLWNCLHSKSHLI